MGWARIKAREALKMTSKLWAGKIVRQGCHGRDKELGRGIGFVGEVMSSVRDCWIQGDGKMFKWKWPVNSQRYGNKPWARGRTWAVNLWVISLMCLQPWEWRQSLCLMGTSKKRGRPKGSRGHEGEPEADGKLQENWKVSRETGEFHAENVKGRTFSKKTWVEKVVRAAEKILRMRLKEAHWLLQWQSVTFRSQFGQRGRGEN